MLTNLQLGAKLEGLNGDNLGNLKFLVADPQDNTITHFVVDRAGTDPAQLVVEANRVKAISDDGNRIKTDLTSEQLDLMPVFREREYTNLGTLNREPREDNTTYASTFPSEAYTGFSGAAGTGFIYPVVPAPEAGAGVGTSQAYNDTTLANTPAPLNPNLAGPIEADTNGPVGIPFTEKLNVPEDSHILWKGAEVEASDGRLGAVKEVNIDPSTGKLISFTVEKGLFFKEEFTIPAEMVESTTDKTVLLRASKAELDNAVRDSSNEHEADYHQA